ncbi:MAG: ABC transporter substrate-binding protein [Chitinophagales bacterium]
MCLVAVLVLVMGVPAFAAKTGGTLVYGRGGDSKSLDPANVTDGESLKVTRQIFDGLVQFSAQDTSVKPALATSWETSKDGLIWTFHLRKGVKFHDGTPFNAEAVKFNFDRWRLKDNPYHKGGSFDYWESMFGGFPGVVKDVKVVDDATVQFTLARPQAPFLANLAMQSFAIASPEAVKKHIDDLGNHPVGTGPFKFVRWDHGDKVTLEANKEYWGGRPYLDRLIYRSIPDNSARLMELQAGNIDIMDGMNPDDVKLVKADKNLQLVLRPSFNVGYLAMNFDKKPFDNLKVRLAIQKAINKQAIVDAFFAGLAKPAKNPMPTSLWGYNDTIKDYGYDPAGAKKLLAEAGFPNGFETTLWAMPVPRPYMPQPQKIAEAIQADLAKIGVKAKIVSYDWATYLDKTMNGEHDMALLGWTGDNGDPDNFLYVLLDKDSAVKPGANNISFYRSDALHDVLIKAQVSSDQKERIALYKKAQVIIHNDAPMVTLVHSTPPIGLKKLVQGYIPHPTESESFLKVWLNK